MMCLDSYCAVGGVIGREHVRVGAGGQDAGAVWVGDDRVVMVVADGCSSGAFSEVGARLGVAWLTRELASAGVAGLRDGLLAFLGSVARGVAGTGAWAEAVSEYLLFGFLAAVVDRERAIVIGAGDGVFAVNEAVNVIDPGIDNAPEYIAYGLFEDGRGRVVVHYDGATADVRSLVLATDGAIDLMRRAEEPIDGVRQGGLEQFTRDARYARNPSLVRKRLAVIGAIHGRLPDDTTVAVMTRRET